MKSGATTQDFHHDRYDCEQRHTSPTYVPGSALLGGGVRPRLNQDLFRSCMRARGWRGGEE